MGKLDWHKRNHDKALGGMMGLSLEERGAYNTVLDLIYAHDDHLADDDRFISGWCQCDVRVWRRIKASLIAKRKLYVEDGLLRNFRATSEILEGLGRVQTLSEINAIKGRKSGQARRKNKELGEPSHEPDTNTTTTTTTTTTRIEEPDGSSDSCSPTKERVNGRDDPEFDGWYAAYPRHVGRGQAAKAYRAARRKADCETLLAGARRAASRYAGTEPQFIPHPATWLNGERWLDTDEPVVNGHGRAPSLDGTGIPATGGGVTGAVARFIARRQHS